MKIYIISFLSIPVGITNLFVISSASEFKVFIYSLFLCDDAYNLWHAVELNLQKFQGK